MRIKPVVTSCEIPAASVLSAADILAAHYWDAYRVPLRHTSTDVVDVFFAILGHHPLWMKRTLITRNRVAAWAGLVVPTAQEILHPQRRPHYTVGDKIGPWPIFSLRPHELLAGHDDLHQDFRLSVLIEAQDGQRSAVMSTVCKTHNAYGRAYLACITPFHSRAVPWLMQRAAAAGRL